MPNASMCAQFESLKDFVSASDGFEFVEEGEKKKKGFVGLRPGLVECQMWNGAEFAHSLSLSVCHFQGASITFSINTVRGERQEGGGEGLVLVRGTHLFDDVFLR